MKHFKTNFYINLKNNFKPRVKNFFVKKPFLFLDDFKGDSDYLIAGTFSR